jgi:prophage regulatory protein
MSKQTKRSPSLGKDGLAQLVPGITKQLADMQTALVSLGVELAAAVASATEAEPVVVEQRARDPEVADPCRLLRVSELAKLLGVYEPTVWRWARTGKMPKPMKVSGRMTACRASEIAAWLEEKAKGTVA